MILTALLKVWTLLCAEDLCGEELRLPKICGHYIGLVTDKNTDAESENIYFFRSRFDKSNEFHFTNYILSRSLNINSRIFPDMRINRTSDQLLQPLLALMFVEQIRAAYKHGIYRCYRNFEEHDSHVRGRIRVERHIRLNPIFNGKIAYTHREYTADNAINRIILTAYDQLCRRNGAFMRNLLNNSKYREVKSFFNQLNNITSPALGQEIHQLLKKNKQKIHHSVYRDWEAVRKTAIQILHRMGIRTHESGQTEVSGFVIDMTKIWESYLKEVLSESNDPSFDFDTQKTVNILEGKKQLKPDFLSKKKDIVMDAKYKNRWEEIAKQIITDKTDTSLTDVREDTFQLLTYMYVFNCNTGVILCPCPAASDDIEKANNDTSKYRYLISNEFDHLKGKSVYLVPLMIPSDSDITYEKFEEHIKKCEENFRRILKTIVEAPKENSENADSTES